jgi:PhzF family phenazine biosynthesis protein
MKSEARLFQVNAFTTQIFRGNPAGVCLLEKPAPEAWMQSLAAEMNLPETAFLVKEGGGYRLRWFTPTVEVPLCGHATLSTAHILWETGLAPADAILEFNTKSGVLRAQKRSNTIELDLPSSEAIPREVPDGLLAALGIAEQPRFYGVKTDFPVAILEVVDETTVRNLKPDFGALKRDDFPEVIVTAKAKSGSEYDFVSRFFAPGIGIDEDPVTGAAHCLLGPYWRNILKKDSLHALQASAREGRLTIRFAPGRVLLGGEAVTVFEAKLSPKVFAAL